MNICNKIKEQRNKLSLSQDELGERIYVTRQTISSWENGKTYPDINSLILLSQVFDMTIDNLIKGDLEIMEQKIEKHDIGNMNKYGNLMGICLVTVCIVLPLSWALAFIPGIVIAALIFAVGMYFAIKVEKIKKQYDVQTYREICAFSKGETLDEISKAQESGKRKYQTVLSFIISGAIGAAIAIIALWILPIIRG